MEGLLSGDDLEVIGTIVINAILTGHLDHSLVGLRTGVLIDDLIHTSGLADLLGQDGLGHGVGIVEGVHDVLHLVDNSSDDLGVAVTQGVNSDAGIEVQIRNAVLVIHIDAVSSFSDEIHTLIGLDHVLLDLSLQFSSVLKVVFQSHSKFLPYKIFGILPGPLTGSRYSQQPVLNPTVLNDSSRFLFRSGSIPCNLCP